MDEAKKPTLAVALMVIGGALAAIGALMPWFKISLFGFSQALKGTEGSDGWVALVAGVLLVIAGIGTWTAKGKGGRAGLGVLALLAGLAAGGLALIDAATAEDSVIDAAGESLGPALGAPAQEAEDAVREWIDTGQLEIPMQAGIFMVIAGGALGLVGGIAGIASRAAVPMLGAVPPPVPMPDVAPPPPAGGPIAGDDPSTT